jgi:hypothetical protein
VTSGPLTESTPGALARATLYDDPDATADALARWFDDPDACAVAATWLERVADRLAEHGRDG